MPPRCQLLSGSLSKPAILARQPQAAPRTFTTSSVLCRNIFKRRKGGDLGFHLPKFVIPQDAAIPEYPYGPALLYKQMDRGLYGGKMIHFGNNVSDKTETRTRRYWKPNVLQKSLYSVALKKRIKLRVTSSVLKTIDREGGLDEYLLKPSESRIKELGTLGWALRWTLLQRPEVIHRMRNDAAALGVPAEEIDRQWPMPAITTVDLPEQALDVAAFEAARDAALNEAAEDAVKDVAEDATEEAAPYADRTITTEAVFTAEEIPNTGLGRGSHDIAMAAGGEYTKARVAGKRYVARGVVGNVHQGVKLALLRAEKRDEDKKRNRESFRERLEAEYSRSLHDESDFKAAMQAHRAAVQERIAAAGGYEEYRKQVKPEESATYAAKVKAAGGEAAFKAIGKAANDKELADAAKAVSDARVPEQERLRIQTALEKAEMMRKASFQANAKQAYIDAALARWPNANKWPWVAVTKQSGHSQKAQGWDALIQASQKESASRSRLRA